MSLTHGNKGLIIPRHYNNAPRRPMNEALTIKNVHKLQQLKALTRVPPQSGCRPSVTIHSGLDSLPNFPIVVIACPTPRSGRDGNFLQNSKVAYFLFFWCIPAKVLPASDLWRGVVGREPHNFASFRLPDICISDLNILNIWSISK